MAILFTVGHSNVPTDRLIELLSMHSISLVVDIRSDPHSKYAPQFNKQAIETELRSKGFDYIYYGDRLGGKPRSPGFFTPNGTPNYEKIAATQLFKNALSEVVTIAETTTLALMCSEADPQVCHRDRMIGWALREQGHEVRHILQDGTILSESQGRLL